MDADYKPMSSRPSQFLAVDVALLSLAGRDGLLRTLQVQLGGNAQQVARLQLAVRSTIASSVMITSIGISWGSGYIVAMAAWL